MSQRPTDSEGVFDLSPTVSLTAIAAQDSEPYTKGKQSSVKTRVGVTRVLPLTWQLAFGETLRVQFVRVLQTHERFGCSLLILLIGERLSVHRHVRYEAFRRKENTFLVHDTLRQYLRTIDHFLKTQCFGVHDSHRTTAVSCGQILNNESLSVKLTDFLYSTASCMSLLLT